VHEFAAVVAVVDIDVGVVVDVMLLVVVTMQVHALLILEGVPEHGDRNVGNPVVATTTLVVYDWQKAEAGLGEAYIARRQLSSSLQKDQNPAL
jgi:hypothetical protein